jgi:hypothetical protein
MPRNLLRSVVIKNLIEFVNTCHIANVGGVTSEDQLARWAQKRIRRYGE